MLSLSPLIRQLYIVEKKGEFVPFPLDAPADPTREDDGWAQRVVVAEVERQYNLGLPVRIIVLKARQLGLSTIASAIVASHVMPQTTATKNPSPFPAYHAARKMGTR